MYTHGTTVNSQMMPTKINKKGAIAIVRIINYNGTCDNIRHLKTSKMISNEIPILLLILLVFPDAFREIP